LRCLVSRTHNCCTDLDVFRWRDHAARSLTASHMAALRAAIAVLILCLAAVLTEASVPVCNGTAEHARLSAEKLFSYWGRQAVQLNSTSPTPRHSNTTEILSSLGQLSDKDRCIFWFEWHAKGGFIHEYPTSHCHGHLREHMDVRCAVQPPQAIAQGTSLPRFSLAGSARSVHG
jgi:hypothetical protein